MVKFYKVMWSNQGSESDATWERGNYLMNVYLTFYSKWYAFQISGRDFYKGEGCNTLGVSLLHLHLHFMNMSIIHPFMSIDCVKHAFETLQHIVIFNVCLFCEMNSVQHLSATCATHF